MASSIASLVVLGPEHLVGGAERGDAEVLLARAASAVSVRRPLIRMIWIFGSRHRARRWRIVGSSMRAVVAGLVDDDVELLLEAAVAGGGRRAPLEAERGLGDLPAVVHAADDVVLRAAGVGEEHLVELGRAVGLDDRPHLDAGLLHRHEQVRDARVLRRVRVGAGEQEDVVGVLGLGGPDLLAVDDPLVAVEHGLGLRATRGRSPASGSLKPWHQAISPLQDLGQEVLLLLLGAPLQDRRADERVAEEVGPQRRAGLGELLVQHHVLHASRGPCRRTPWASVAQIQPPSKSLLGPLLVERAGASPRVISKPSSNQPVGQVLLEPGADLLAERLGFGRVGQVHAAILTDRVRPCDRMAGDPSCARRP